MVEKLALMPTITNLINFLSCQVIRPNLSDNYNFLSQQQTISHIVLPNIELLWQGWKLYGQAHLTSVEITKVGSLRGSFNKTSPGGLRDAILH